MGKLLQKLVTGIVPSWLTKIKSSADASPKKLLPYFKAIHVSSSSPSSSKRHDAQLPPLVAFDNTDQSIDDDEDPCSKACNENAVISASPSFTQQERTANIKQKAHNSNENRDNLHHQDHNEALHQEHLQAFTKNSVVSASPSFTMPERSASMTQKSHKSNKNHDDRLYHEDDNEPHHSHYMDGKTNSKQRMHEHDTNSRASPCSPHSRKQGAPSIHNEKHEQQQQQIYKSQPGLEKSNQIMSEADKHHHHKARSSRHNVNHRELSDMTYLEPDRDVVCMQEENPHNHHDKQARYEGDSGDEQYKILYHDLLGLKRKSQHLQEEAEYWEEEEEVGSHGSGNIDTTEWGWKRRKGERGLMSCELPESICFIVGNGKAVVKYSKDPHMALWESMVEMIVGNGLWELGSLEFLLFCYLSLNEPHLHPIIQSTFLQVLKDLEKI